MSRENLLIRWTRRLLTLILTIWVLLVTLIVVGTLFPGIPLLSAVATLITSALTLHIVLAALLGTALSYLVIRLGGRTVPRVALGLGIFTTVGALIPVFALVESADSYGARLSWRDHLFVTAPASMSGPDATVQFNEIDGQALFLDVYLPSNLPAGQLSPPVVMMHGGGFAVGNRSDGRDWDRWLADQGYTVFDVDYRLLPPPNWETAAQDVACAMAWIADRAETYNIDASRFMSAGQSAGAILALQVAYGQGAGPVVSNCGGVVPEVAAVLAFYPIEDFVLGWELDTTIIGSIGVREISKSYIGGTLDEYPDRYRAVSAAHQVRPGLPPTFIAYGANDHLVPPVGHILFAEQLANAQIPFSLVRVPYGEHAYDLVWGSLGAQISRHVAGEFLQTHLPLR